MDKRSTQCTLPLFGDLGSWDAPAPPRRSPPVRAKAPPSPPPPAVEPPAAPVEGRVPAAGAEPPRAGAGAVPVAVPVAATPEPPAAPVAGAAPAVATAEPPAAPLAGAEPPAAPVAGAMVAVSAVAVTSAADVVAGAVVSAAAVTSAVEDAPTVVSREAEPALRPTEPGSPLPRRAPRAMETDSPTPLPRRAPAGGDPDLPTLVSRRAPSSGDEGPAVPRRPAADAEPDFPTPVPRRAPRSMEPELPTPAPRRAPAGGEPEHPTPLPRRAPRSMEPEHPTPAPRRAPSWGEEGAPPARRPTAGGEPELPAPVPRRAPSWSEADAPMLRRAPPWGDGDAPLMRRAPVSTEPDLPTPAPRSGPGGARAGEAEEQILSVADLDRRIKRVVEGSTESVRVAGEVSSFKAHANGNAYFTLKDEAEDAAIDCVMYRSAAPRYRRVLEDGARVVVRGRATVFVPRGKLQLIVDEARLAGRGALLEALERLKEKLHAEGLFDPSRKRPLPRDPKVIGVVTSASGAAIHDIIKVAFARGAVRLVLARAPVQGRDAAPRMARALATLSRMRDVEAIIVGRGGGSADDLLAFNEEVLVREAARCRVPVVSAVGHEVDISLLDLVADARAATPSQAAEMLVPDANARRGELAHLALRMRRALAHEIGSARADVERREGKLLGFSRSLAERQQGIDDALGRLEKEMGRRLAQRRSALAQVDRALWSRHPRAVVSAARRAIEPLGARLAPAASARLAEARGELSAMSARLARAVERRLDAERSELAQAASRLSAMSPLAVLARGYAIATKDGRAVRSAGEVAAGDRLRVRLHEGAVVAQVVAVEPGEDSGG